jgi:ABC-type transport system involved in multi-copper enzyme maturation permease subunit
MKIAALIADTFREIYARKAILGIVVIELLALALTGIVLFTDGMQRSYRDAALAEQMIDRYGRSDRGPAKPEAPDPEQDSLLGIDSAEKHSIDSARSRPGSSSRTFEIGTGDSTKAPHEIKEGALLHEMVQGQLGFYAASIYFAVLFMGIFATASIVPSMMEKGNIDLLVSKPISRTALLFGRALGGFLGLALNLALFVVAVWALYGWASGVWYTPFIFWSLAIPLFSFVVLYSAIILLNVITESAVLPMILAYIHLMILSNFLTSREALLYQFITGDIPRAIIDGLYYILPQTNDLWKELPEAIFTSSFNATEPLIQGSIFTIVMLALASWRFERKDF